MPVILKSRQNPLLSGALPLNCLAAALSIIFGMNRYSAAMPTQIIKSGIESSIRFALFVEIRS